MLRPNLDVYNLRTKQNFMSLLNQFEAEGITDIRFVRERVQRHIETAGVGTPGVYKRTRKVRVPVIRCSEDGCNAIMRRAVIGETDGDLKIFVCPECRFSKVVT